MSQRALSTLVGYYEAAFDAVAQGSAASRDETPAGSAAPYLVMGPEVIPRMAEGVRLARLSSDYCRVIRYLRKKSRLGRIPIGPADVVARRRHDNRIEVLRLSPLSAQLLRLCDGARSVEEIV